MTKPTSSEIEVAPRASALIESLRDIGYSFEAAVADLIDNSISADATDIRLMFSAMAEVPYVAIIDNGRGMTADELTEAMRPGSRSPLESRDANDLGRFGLGLKTASFSQCRNLTVVSRKKKCETSGRQWNLDRVAESGQWLLKVLTDEEIASLPEMDLLGDQGTIVCWRQLDRLEGQYQGLSLGDALTDAMSQAEKHLQLVFHRFLGRLREDGGKVVSLTINAHPVKPFDPFGREYGSVVQQLPEERIAIERSLVRIVPYILPHHSKLSDSDYSALSGDEGYVRNQGFYVYRNRRLIIHGTWFRLVRQSELTKLARVQVDIPNTLDHLWSIDVKKARAAPPEAVRREMKRVIDQITGRSTRVYTFRGRSTHTDGKMHVWDRLQKQGRISYRLNRDHPLVKDFSESLTPQQRRQFLDVERLIEELLPLDALYADLAGHRRAMSQDDEESVAAARDMAARFVQVLKDAGADSEAIVQNLRSTEPFCLMPNVVEQVLKEWGFSK
jgi:hypothetical protein